MADTKRSQNKCRKCGYTWFPRGKNISLKCPSCGSTDVGFASAGIGAIALCGLAILMFAGDKNDRNPIAAQSELVSSKGVAGAAVITSETTVKLVSQEDPMNAGEIQASAVTVKESEELLLATDKCDVYNENRPVECPSADCLADAQDGKCRVKLTPKTDLF